MNNKLKPVVKWAGGKRAILPFIKKYIPRFDLYVEPFIGGASVLFDIMPPYAVINDLNAELINMYNAIKYDIEPLISLLNELQMKHAESTFYEIRNIERDVERYANMSNSFKAARLIYLNKTCFNGLYRVNKQGFFNVPYGKRENPTIYDENNIRSISKYLNQNNILIKHGDYKDVLNDVNINDKEIFVYLDPPYMNTYTGYTEKGFSYNNQIELRDYCNKLNENGIKFLQSNIYCNEIKELYADYNIEAISVRHMMNRANANEVLICNYDN